MNKKILVLALLAAVPSRAQETASFLKIGNGARALGMGGAYTAVANDITSLSWNPAGLGYIEKRELGGMHAELAAGTRYDFLGYAQPTRYGVIASGISYLGQGAIDSRDSSGRLTGSYGASDSTLNLGFGTRLGRASRLGVNVKFIRSSISGVTGETAALDMGVTHELGLRGPGIPSIGFAFQNLGPGMKLLDQSSPLPLTFATGVGYRLPFGLTFAADYKYRPNGKSSEISMGTEYAIFSGVALRTGYASNHGPLSGSTKTSDMTGLAAGFGIRLLNYNLDYSVTPFGGLGNAQRFSFGARF